MQKPWEEDNCTAMRARYAVYSIPQAAALWCGVPEDQLQEIVSEAEALTGTGLGRSIWCHPHVKCLEPRSRAIAEAIENGELPHGREDAQTVDKDEHVAYERRHFFGRDLRKWMEKTFPNEKPAFLFDDIEQNSHTAISADAYRTLLADRDAQKKRLEKAKEEFRKLRAEKNEIQAQLEQLKKNAPQKDQLGPRAESTYQNIIAALLGCINGELPNVKKHPSFTSEAKLIDAIEQHYKGYGGLSRSNLSRKFPEAKRALESR